MLQYSTSHDIQSDLRKQMENSYSSIDSRNLGSCCGSFWGSSVSSWWSPAVSCELFIQGLFIVENDSISVKRRVEHHPYALPCTLAVNSEIPRYSKLRHLPPKEVLSKWTALVCHLINNATLLVLVHKHSHKIDVGKHNQFLIWQILWNYTSKMYHLLPLRSWLRLPVFQYWKHYVLFIF